MKRVLICCLVVLIGPTAVACTICVSKPLKFAFQDSTYFFVGRVVDVEEWATTFRVVEQLKGEPVSEVTLSTSGSCSLSGFKVGQDYVVEVTPTAEGELHAYLCSHTQTLKDGDEVLATVRSRAPWWSSPLSRFFSWYRFRHVLGRVVGG